MIKKNITIIGAGIAGLTTAYYLAKTNQYNVTLIEKEKRIGGRILSVPYQNQHFELGGFIILRWYKEFLALCEELTVTDSFETFENFKEYYYSPAQSNVVEAEFKPSIKEYLSYARLMLPYILRGKLNFYKPDYSLFGGKSAGEVIEASIGKNSQILAAEKIIIQGYTYPNLYSVPMSIFAPFIMKMLGGYFNTSKLLFGNTEILVEKIVEFLHKQGVQILTNTKVESVSGHDVTTDKGNITFDKLAVATTLNSHLFKGLGINLSGKYTSYSCVVIKMEKPSIIMNSDKWTVIYIPEESNLKTVSVYNRRGVNDSYDSTYLTLYIKVVDRPLSFDEIRSEMKKVFPDNYCSTEIVRKDWVHLMPVITSDELQNISRSQGLNDIYFAGDYFSWPTMEAAVASGKQAATSIMQSL